MLKLGFAFLFVTLFACNFCENSRAEEPEKQEDVILERGGGSREASEKDDDGFAVEDDSDYAFDEHPREDSGKEGQNCFSLISSQREDGKEERSSTENLDGN